MRKDVKVRLYKNIVLIMLVTLIFGLVPANIVAATELDFDSGKLEEFTKIRVGYYRCDGFQEGQSDADPKAGYSYEYLQKIANYGGFSYEYVYGEWDYLYNEFLEGRIDILPGVGEGQLEGIALLPEQSMGTEKYFLCLGKDAMPGRKYQKAFLHEKRVGVLKNGSTSEMVEAWNEQYNVGIKKVEYDGYTMMMADFEAGEIYGMVLPDCSIMADSIFLPLEQIGENKIYLAVSSGNEKLCEAIQDAVNWMNHIDPYFAEKLQSEYYGKCTVSYVLSRQEEEWISTHPAIRVGYLKGDLPFCDSTKRGTATGLVTDVVPAILEELGIQDQVSVLYYPFDSFDSMADELLERRLDLIFPVTGTTWSAESQKIMYSNPVIINGMSLMYNGNYNDSKMRIIAVNKNNMAHCEYIKSHFPESQILECDSNMECLAAIAEERAGSTVFSTFQCNSFINDSNYSTLRALQLPTDDVRCFAMNNDDNGLLQLVNRGLDGLEENYGSTMAYKYMGELYKYTARDFVEDHSKTFRAVIVVAILIILSGACVTYYLLRRQKELDRLKNAELEEALRSARSSNDAMTAVYDALGASKWNLEYDISGKISKVWHNYSGASGFGMTESSDVGREMRAFFDAIHPDDVQMVRVALEKTLMDPEGKTPFHVEYRRMTSKGQYRWIQSLGRPSVKPDGTYGIFYSIFIDITERKEREMQEYEAATLDALTRLHNRNSFEIALQELEAQGEQLKDVTAVTIDINRLKEINDTIGHTAGDDLIKGAAQIIYQVFGNIGECYRIGGDEFFVILRGSSFPMDELKKQLDLVASRWRGEVVSGISLSCGYASASEFSDPSIGMLIKASDKRMYMDKADYYQRMGIERRK